MNVCELSWLPQSEEESLAPASSAKNNTQLPTICVGSTQLIQLNPREGNNTAFLSEMKKGLKKVLFRMIRVHRFGFR